MDSVANRRAALNTVGLGLLGTARNLLLETVSARGEWQGRPVRFVIHERAAIVRLSTSSAAVEAIRDRPTVRVGACSRRGRRLNGHIECVARVVPQERRRAAAAAFDQGRTRLSRLRRSRDGVYLEIEPMPSAVTAEAPRLLQEH
jgi:hypothetical protein